MKGYAGDPAWTSFTAVIYQTGAFLRLDQVQAEAKKVGVPMAWKTLIVTGAGSRPPRGEKETRPSATKAASEPRIGVKTAATKA